jgi:16S rRNA (adenine1518-N6/adenine1519-N6)-dimethyltransferase
LVRVAGQVIAIELDSRLATRLRNELIAHTNLTIYQQDILTIDLAQITQGRPYCVVANLPYAITSPVLRHFLESTHPPEHMTVLVQREVAQRICATPGDMSVLAHAMQIRAVPELIAIVPPESFMPAPEVYSAVLRLRKRATPLIDPHEEPAVMKVIKAGFLHARKQLGNSLASGLAAHGMQWDRADVQTLLRQCDIDPMRRAETLSFDEWVRVSRALTR